MCSALGQLALRFPPARLTVVLCLALAAALPSQPPARLTLLDVVVSAGGQAATGLGPGDFEVLDEGRPQRLLSFGYAPLPPGEPLRSTAIVIDDLGIGPSALAALRPAFGAIVRSMRPGDAVAIVSTSGRLRTLPGLSADKRAVAAAIESIDLDPGRRPGALEPGFCGRGDTARSALLTLAALRRTVDGLRDLPGRKSIVLISEGFSRALNPEVREAYASLLPYANRSAVAIDTVDPRPATASLDSLDCAPDRRSELAASRDALAQLAAGTGGISVANSGSLDDTISQAVVDGAGYYLLGYEPARHAPVHAISVRVKRPGLTVRYHSSLFETGAGDLGRRMSAALDAPFALAGVRARVYSVFWDAGDPAETIQSAIWVDARDLTFSLEPGGNRKAEFDLVVETLGPNLETVDTFRQTYTVEAPPAYYQTILGDGLTQRLHLAPKGSGEYRIRAAVHDRASDRIGSAAAFVEVPGLASGALALTGIAIAKAGDPAAAPGTSPRRFHPGQTVSLGYRVLNGRSVEVTVALIYAGQVLAETAPAPVDAARALQVRDFQFGDDLSPGTYSITVTALDRAAPPGHNTAAQSVEFEID